MPELDASVPKLKEEYDGLSAQHASLHAQIAELSSAVETLSSAGAKCPVCDSDLAHGKAEKISAEKKGILEKKKSELHDSGESLKEKMAALKSLEKKAYDLSLISAEAERLAREGIEAAPFADGIAKKAEARKKKEEELKKGMDGVAKLEAAVQQSRKALEEAQRTARLFSETDEASQKLALAREEMGGLDFSESAYEEKRHAYEELRLRSAKMDAEAAGASSQLGLMEELCTSMQKEIARMEEKGSLAEKYSSAAESMAIYKNSLSAAQAELRSSLVEEINEALAEVWPSVYPYSDYGGVKIQAGEKDYLLLMEKAGQWREVDSIASGGERACLCLALRIAFATVLTPDIGWLILDEPTHNLDSDAVLLLSEAINQKIPSIVEQTFVITHDSALGENSEGSVFLLTRDKGKNESTKVEIVG